MKIHVFFIFFLNFIWLCCSPNYRVTKDVKYDSNNYTVIANGLADDVCVVANNKKDLILLKHHFKGKLYKGWSEYNETIVIAKDNIFHKEIRLVNSNLFKIKDSLKILKKNYQYLEKDSTIIFTSSLKSHNIPFYITNDTSLFNYVKEIAVTINVNKRNQSFHRRKKLQKFATETIFDYLKSSFPNRRVSIERNVYFNNCVTNCFNVEVLNRDELNSVPETLLKKFIFIKKVDLGEYLPIKYAVYYFQNNETQL